MSSESSNLPPLGAQRASLAGQSGPGSARQVAARRRRNVLVIIGLIYIVMNLFALISVHDRLQKEAADLQAKGQLIDHDKLAAIVRASQVAAVGFMVLGVVFLLLGLTVRAYPVPITITAFVIYVATNVVIAIADPELLARRLYFQDYGRGRVSEGDPSGPRLSA